MASKEKFEMNFEGKNGTSNTELLGMFRKLINATASKKFSKNCAVDITWNAYGSAVSHEGSLDYGCQITFCRNPRIGDYTNTNITLYHFYPVEINNAFFELALSIISGRVEYDQIDEKVEKIQAQIPQLQNGILIDSSSGD